MTDKDFALSLELAGNGDRQAFQSLYNEFFGLVYSTALAVTCSKTAAEDITSEFFIRLWEKKITGFCAGHGGHRKYLSVCAKNLAVNYIKKFGKEELLSMEDGENNSPYEDTEEKMTEKALVSDALKKLSEDEREIIHLKYFCGYTLKEISKVLDIPLGTAAWRCRNSEKKLKKIIGEVQ